MEVGLPNWQKKSAQHQKQYKQFLKRCPLLLYSLPSDMFNNIMTFSVAGLGLQERLALKSAVTFMVRIYELLYSLPHLYYSSLLIDD